MRPSRALPFALLLAFSPYAPVRLCPAAGAVEPGWSDAFPSGHVNDRVHAAAVFDEDGPGGAPAVLVAGGDFDTAGGLPAERIARWNGDRWSAILPGLDGPVHALAVLDTDGPGPGSSVLIVGGEFSTAGGIPASNIAAWNGTSWSALGNGVAGADAAVHVLSPWDADPGGPQNAVLVVGGRFDQAGSQAAGGLATWDGTSWQPLGTGTTATVYTVAQFGSDLWAGGDFDELDGQTIARLARFDGATWSSGGTLIPATGEVRALATWSDGGGKRLAIGGTFDLIDSTVARNVAAFDDGSFVALGAGLGTFTDRVDALTAFDPDGTDGTLWAAGDFGTGSMRNLARFDGATWSGVGEIRYNNGPGWVRTLTPFDADAFGSAEPRLWIGGHFNRVGDVRTTTNACEWDGTRLVPLGNGLVTGYFQATYAASATSFDPDGPGPSPMLLYVRGWVHWAGEVQPSGNVVVWNGTEWMDPDFGANDYIWRIEALDLGDGPELYLTGEFTQIGGIPANHIAKWDGVTWSALGSGIDDPSYTDLHAWDPDGAGPSPAVLVVAGESLTLAGGVTVDRVAKWDGSAWSDLGYGRFGYYGVTRLGTYDDDGDGVSSLFAVKNTGHTNGVCNYVDWFFRFDGPGWTDFGSGYGFYIPDLETYDPDDAGPADEQLYLPVQVLCVDPEEAPGEVLARWNGSWFQDMGLPHEAEPGALEAIDLDGDGPGFESLFAFNVTGEDEIAGYDGTSWTVIGKSTQSANGLLGPFAELSEYDPDGAGPMTPQLVVFGEFPSLEEMATGDVVSSGSIGMYGHEGIVTATPVLPPAEPGPVRILTAGRVHPTPFRDLARVAFTLTREAVVGANVFDVHGRRVRRLLDARFPEGSHVVTWDGTEQGGGRAGSGVYFLRLEAHGESVTRRIVRIE